MAFRRELFERIAGFDPRFGGVGTRLFRGEELELINRALQRSLKIVYDPAVMVLHRIGAERTRRPYFRKLIFDAAEGEARAEPRTSGYSFLGAPVWRYRVAFADFWEWVSLLLLRRPEAFDRQLDWLSSLGRLSGYWKSALERRMMRRRLRVTRTSSADPGGPVDSSSEV
jgi:GT2 family glycosyltransferase